MDSLNVPNVGFILWPLNTLNFMVGIAHDLDFNFISGMVGLIVNLTWALYKFYRQVKTDALADKKEEKEERGNSQDVYDIDNQPFKRRCVGCSETFEPEHPDQIFHTDACRTAYMHNVKNRKPFIKKQE